MPRLSSLAEFQSIVGRALVLLGIAHVPLLIAVGWLLGANTFALGAAALVLACLPTFLSRISASRLAVGYGIAATLVGQTSLLVYAVAGHPWQVETHFYSFAILAMLSGFCQWRILIFAAGLIILNAGLQDALMPAALRPDGGDMIRTTIHAAVLAIETAMLVLIAKVIRSAFEQTDQARAEAERAATEIKQFGEERERDLAAATRRVATTMATLDGFKREMAESVDVLHRAATALQISSDSVGAATARSSAQAATASIMSDDMASRMAIVAEAGEELARTISDVGVNVSESSRLAANAVAEAEKTNEVMRELTNVADEIGNVTGVINAIAAQTNLLALNATIEAARAGSAGRGFAVVAEEVKALAGQTAKATQDIALRIAAIQSATIRSVDAMQLIGGTIRELDQFSARIAAAMEHQAESAGDIGANVNSAASGVGHVSDSIAKIESVTQQTTDAVAQLGEAALDVASQARKIRERVGLFAEDVRAAQA